jgi:signal transduction histidine kinase
MKLTITSFLFFILSVNTNIAQNQADSLSYYSNLALKPQSASDLSKAYAYFDSQYSVLIEEENVLSAVNTLYYKSSILFKNGEYYLSEETAVKALKHLDKLDKTDYVEAVKLSFNNLLGLIYTEQNNKQKAIELYEKTLASVNNALDSAKVYNNISILYEKFGDIENAKKEILMAYTLIPNISDPLTQAVILDNYGTYESHFDKENGLKLLKKALNLRKMLSDTATIYTSFFHFSQYYQKTDSLKKAKEYAVKALELANVLNSESYKNNALGLLTELSEDKYAKAYKKLNDSLYKAEKERKNQFALIKYDYSTFEKAAIENKLKAEEERTSKLIFIFIAALIAIISISIFFVVKSKHKKDKLQQVFNTEARISKKIHDEVANDMYNVMVKLQGQKNDSNTIINDLEELYFKTRDISKDNSLLDVEVDYNNYLNDMLCSFTNNETTVITKNINVINWARIPKLTRQTIYRVLQELMVNMKKHSNASHVFLNFNQKAKNLIIEYSDNGKGCELNKKGGLLNVETRINTLNGNITFESQPDNGFKVKIKI